MYFYAWKIWALSRLLRALVSSIKISIKLLLGFKLFMYYGNQIKQSFSWGPRGSVAAVVEIRAEPTANQKPRVLCIVSAASHSLENDHSLMSHLAPLRSGLFDFIVKKTTPYWAIEKPRSGHFGSILELSFWLHSEKAHSLLNHWKTKKWLFWLHLRVVKLASFCRNVR